MHASPRSCRLLLALLCLLAAAEPTRSDAAEAD